jgi:excisionase family DNA binding protein
MSTDTSPLFVRLPVSAARKLDRASFELGASKKDLVTALLERHVDPESPGGLAALRRVVVETGDEPLTVGRHAFRPAEPPAVLTAGDVAELLQVEEAEVVALAEAGDLPARRIGEAWRFSREAVLAWLGAER